MIVDTSAVVAILNREPGYATLVNALEGAGKKALSAASYVELCTVAGRSQEGRVLVDETLAILGIEVVSLDPHQAQIAATAYQRFGRGSGHPARLNMGDVYSYALASARNKPLLFVGDDFAHTDMIPALP